MNQAQGAIDGARAAGAEQYAPDELKSALDALRGSERAVTQNDYRLALSLAIESRDRAQAASRAAADARAKARGDAERVLAEATALATQGREQLAGSAVARIPRRTVQQARTALAAADKSLQEARTALNSENYTAALASAQGAATRLQAAFDEFDDGGKTSARKRPK